jgi:hypothetical protein
MKGPDLRYQSAYGLKADLLECQRRLLETVSSVTEQSAEVSFHARSSIWYLRLPIAYSGL